MKVEFDEWSEHDWYGHPTGTRTEDLPGYKKTYGGVGFTEAGRIYVSKNARWRKALFWHERGHCLLFESGRVLVPGASSLSQEIMADSLADLAAGTYQTLGMLVMILRRAKGRNNKVAIQRRIDAVCQRHPKIGEKYLEKLTRGKHHGKSQIHS